ncbi:hypothetical protein HYZ99_03005 [Candidatus Peregrinibacteria bacterium]|nr:hypothetical protein [Candidatus Peregrinibacteria bacterium]
MHIHIKLSAIVQSFALLASLLSPAYAFAAPGGVTGIQAEVVEGEVRVRWNAATDGDPAASYRVYYNTESILENDGEYDDFEETNDPVTQHILRDFPPSMELYISVLAVGPDGVESDFFLEEVNVFLGQEPEEPLEEPPPEEEPSSSSQEIPTPTLPSEEEPSVPGLPMSGEVFAVVSAESISATGVLVTFSLPVVLAPDQAANAFMIKNSSGTQLALTRLTIAGNRVQINTEVQERNVAYIVEASSVLQGRAADPTASLVTLSPAQDKGLFLGHGMGKEARVFDPRGAQSQSSIPVQPRDIANLNIRATPGGNNRYDVTVTWRDTNPPGAVASFEVTQSPDNGRTFSAPQLIPGNTTMVTLRGVPAGEFGVAVRAISSFGTASAGVFKSVALPPLSTPDDLSSSGVGTAAILTMAGAVMGWRKMRTKSTKH